MALLIVGLILWIGAHLFKRLAPARRESLGPRGAGIMTGLILASVALMVLGYRGAEVVPVYAPMPGAGHANNTLMLISVFLFGVGGTKVTLYTRMRHPMLWGTVVWSVAHLLVNGDMASLVLFGGIAVWALVSMALINATGPWARPVGGRGLKGDAMNLAGTLLLFGLIALVHKWLGHPVFLGTYP